MKKLVSALMSVALVVGLCPALAYADLSAGGLGDGYARMFTQANKGFVADRVYALIGNKYAMMVTEKNQVQTINIVNSSYQSTLKMVCKETPNQYGGYDITPKSAYQYMGLLANGVKVQDKNSGKTGLLAFSGKKMISCSFDSLSEDESGGYVLGTAKNAKGNGTITVFSGASGKKLASANVGKADSLYAYWSAKHSKISVSRYYRSNSSFKSLQEVYSFDGKKLSRTSSKSGSSEYFTIAPSIVQRYGPNGSAYYTSAKSSGKLIKSLSGWSYAGMVSSGKYLFYSPGTKKAKIVNGKANTLVSLSASSAQLRWGTIGSYIYSTTDYDEKKAVQTIYSTKGKKVLTLPKGQSLHALSTTSAVKYYACKTATVKALGGANVTSYRSVKYYDSSLKTLKNVNPALGERIRSVNGMELYDSGRDAAGNLTRYYGYKQSVPDVVTAAGKEVKLGKYTLSRPVRGSYLPISKSDMQFGSKNAYTAKSSSGKFGLVSSSGKALIPVEYDDVFCGSSGSRTLAKGNKVMVKKNGVWSFRSVS